MVALPTLTPLPMPEATTPDKAGIDATGTAPAFCTIANDRGAISMAISAAGDQLSDNGSFSYVANGNSKVALSAVQQITPPGGAATSIPNISLADLVSNSSSSAEAASAGSDGVVRKEGAITASIAQKNTARLLTAGDYALQATATCTSP